jgi:uncharacterized membrane protein YqgA involved in biofilm formation
MIPGIGTALNTATIVAGTSIGLTLGRVIPESLQRTIRVAIGLFVVVIGLQMAFKTHNALVLLISLLSGVVIGEVMRLDAGLHAVADWAEQRLRRGGEPGRVSTAFITTTLIFCVGPLAVLGSFLDGTKGDITLLAIKSTLDGVTSMVFAATLGWGVYVSAISVLIVQGLLTLIAFLLHAGLTNLEIAELTAAGGIAVLAIALGLLDIKQIKVANFLPSLIVAPALAAILHSFGLLN